MAAAGKNLSGEEESSLLIPGIALGWGSQEASWTKIKCTEAFPIQPGGDLCLQPVVLFTIWQQELKSISIRGFARRRNKGKVGAGFSFRLLLPGQAGGFAVVA